MLSWTSRSSFQLFHPREISRQQVATVAGFSVKGGTFSTYLSELKRARWIVERMNRVSVTSEGMRNAGDVPDLPSDSESIIEMWASKFRQGAARMLKALAEKYPDSVTKEELGDFTGFTISGGTFSTYLSELRRNGLITVEGDVVRATKELFLED